MKLADDFLSYCLNYQQEFGKVKLELEDHKEEYDETYKYYSCKPCVEYAINKTLFQLEEKDLNNAIELCKKFNRDTAKDSYENKLKQFKEYGTYAGDGNPQSFLLELQDKLIGRSVSKRDKRMLIDEALKKRFPEMDEINAARKILYLAQSTLECVKQVEIANKNLLIHRQKMTSVAKAKYRGASLLEIAKQWGQHEGS